MERSDSDALVIFGNIPGQDDASTNANDSLIPVLPLSISTTPAAPDDITTSGVCGSPGTGALAGRCGYGPRLPFLLISPWAKTSFVDHTLTDQTSSLRPVPDYTSTLEEGARGVSIGIPAEYFGEGLDPEVEASVRLAMDALVREGAKLVPISLPNSPHAIATYYIVATAEASSNLARYDGIRYGHRAASIRSLGDLYERTRAEGFGAEVKRRILLGTYALSAGYYDAYYLRAQKIRALIRRDFDQAFAAGIDAVLSPTSPTPAFKLGEKIDDPLAMYLNDIYTVPANLAGLPGISVPCGFSKGGLPIGLQLIGRPFEEAALLRIACAAERAVAVPPRELPL